MIHSVGVAHEFTPHVRARCVRLGWSLRGHSALGLTVGSVGHGETIVVLSVVPPTRQNEVASVEQRDRSQGIHSWWGGVGMRTNWPSIIVAVMTPPSAHRNWPVTEGAAESVVAELAHLGLQGPKMLQHGGAARG